MAAASSSHPSTSLINSRNKYDVFLSFRGEDTRNNFISHLYEVLSQHNIETFIDDQLIRGDEISKSLLDAIEASNISLIVFSERYASSRWCLDELLKIFDCKKKYQQIVIPIFYDVDPSHVRKQIGTFGELFSKLQGGPDKMQTWRNTLSEAADISGFHSQNFRTESELIKEVVNHIVKRLAEAFPRDNKDQVVGVESKVRKIESLLALDTESKDVLTLGIWGIGGIGKTTIAKVVFHKIYKNFEGYCFLHNVREESERPGGLTCLQQNLFSNLLNVENVKPGIIDSDFNFRRLSRKKVLIVLDDVTCLNQFESLIGSLDWFMPQSRIIITTRDKQVLRNCNIKKIFKVKTLEYRYALKLFSRHAFKQNHPNIGYKELVDKVTNYANGVPLALKVLGCYLFEREKEVWESAISKLEKIVHPNIQKVLKISYDGLDDLVKNIFLDLACFFKGWKVDIVMKFLDVSGFHPVIGMRDLVDKSLITISSSNLIIMHDLLQEMGREIVRQESVNDPGKRSRLWHHEDIFNVLKFNTGTEAIEGICLDMSKVKEISLNPDTFTKMRNLRFLKFYNSINGENKCKTSYFQGPKLAQVKYLHWHGYPWKSFPSNIDLEKLVSLEMPNSNIEQLWDSVQHHGTIRQIISAICQKFTKIPNPSLTGHPNNLVTLNLNNCKSLKSLPKLTHLECLKDLDVSNCLNLKMIPEFSNGNIEKIRLRGTAIEEVPSSIGCLSRLLQLDLEKCKSLKSLPSSLCKLKSLRFLILSSCSNLQRLPDELGNLESLVRLDACETAIKEVPLSISRLKYLNFLEFKGIGGLSLSISLYLDGLHDLVYLDLTDCGISELPQSLFQLSFLQKLFLGKNNFEMIPEDIIQLHCLQELHISNCERVRSLPKLPRYVHRLQAHDCTALESVSSLLPNNECHPTEYGCILGNNFKLDRRILDDALQHIKLMETAHLKRLHEGRDYARAGHVILPGNEIPKWFRFQSMGSYVSLNMPPGFFNNNKVIGFAFSFIVEFREPHVGAVEFYLAPVCNLESKECDSPFLKKFFCNGKYRVQSDHLILGYCFVDEIWFDRWTCSRVQELVEFRKQNYAFKAVKFYCNDIESSKVMECSPVKKCGVHLFYVSADEAKEMHRKRPAEKMHYRSRDMKKKDEMTRRWRLEEWDRIPTIQHYRFYDIKSVGKSNHTFKSVMGSDRMLKEKKKSRMRSSSDSEDERRSKRHRSDKKEKRNGEEIS